MAQPPLSSLLSNSLFQGGALAASTLALTGCDMDATSTTAVGLTVGVLGAGAALAYRRLSQMRQTALPQGRGVAGLLQSQQDVPEADIRANLTYELAERYTVLGDPTFSVFTGKLEDSIFKAWDQEGRPADSDYPYLRGCIPESLIEKKIQVFADYLRNLGSLEGEQERFLRGLDEGADRKRSVRWAARNVETTAERDTKSIYPCLQDAGYAAFVTLLSNQVLKDWIKAGSPSVIDKRGPATPQIEDMIHARVQKFMAYLAQNPGDAKMSALLRDLRRDEKRRLTITPTLFHRLTTTAREIEILSLQAAQLRFPNETLLKQFRRAVAFLAETPEAASKEDLARYAAVEGVESDKAVVRELVGRLPGLKARADEARVKEEAMLQERLRWLQAAVSGSRPVAGLDARSVGLLHPSLPEWARDVSFQQTGAQAPQRLVLDAAGKVSDEALGFEISYRDGGYWLRDARGFSRLHPANWLRAFSMNGQKISAGGSWPVRSGDRLRVGPDVEIEFVFPDEPPLEKLKLKIARIATLEDLAKELRLNGRKDIASQIEAYLSDGDDFHDLPAEGGLAAKISELVLRKEASRIHEKYFLDLPYHEAETRMMALARAVDSAASMQDLAGTLSSSSLSDGVAIAAAILRVAGETVGLRSFDKIPEIFGLREKVLFFAQDAERKLRVEAFQLSEQVSLLAGKLRDAEGGIVNRDDKLREARAKEEDLTKQLRAAGQALQEQEAAAQAEKARLEGVQRDAALAAERTREDLIRVHNAAQASKDATHREALITVHENHEAILAKKATELRALEASHAKSVRELTEAHEAAVKDLRAKNESELAGKDEAARLMGERHARELAELQERQRVALLAKKDENDRLVASHAQAIREKDAAHTAAVAAQTAANKEALAKLNGEYGAALERITGEHARAMADLEARRAAAQADADRLAGEKAEVEARRVELAATLRQTQDRLETAEQTRDRYREERNAARTRLQETEGSLEIRGGELRDEQEKTARNDKTIGELTEKHDAARAEIARLTPELEAANAELTRLLDTDLPKLDKQIADKTHELKAITSALFDFEIAFDAHTDTMKNLIKGGAEIQRVEEYLDKLMEVKTAVWKKIEAAGEEPGASDLPAGSAANDGEPLGTLVLPVAARREIDLPPPAPAEGEEVPLAEIEFVDPLEEPTETEIQIPSAPPPPKPVTAAPVSVSTPQRLSAPNPFFFGGVDPRTHKVELEDFVVNDQRELWNIESKKVGLAWICAGNHVGRWQDRQTQTGQEPSALFNFGYNDESLFSAKTSAGRRDYQEDGVYMASYELPDGRTVKVIAGVDGAGGMGGGDIASSAFLQSIHAVIQEAAATGRAVDAGFLFKQGEVGTQFQKDAHSTTVNATGSASVVVILGDQMTVATKGDSMVVHGRKQADGSYATIGYSDVQHMASAGNDILLESLRRGLNNPNLDHKNAKMITSGISMKGEPTLNIATLKPGDQIWIQSDGGHEHTAGDAYKVNASSLQRGMAQSLNLTIPGMTQEQFAPFNRIMALTEGQPEAAFAVHDLAVKSQQRPSRPPSGSAPVTVPLFDGEFELPARRQPPDNVFSINYQQGEALEPSAPVSLQGYRPLEAPGSDLFGGWDPRTHPVQPLIDARLPIRGPQGVAVGMGVMTAGGAENAFAVQHTDGSLISAKTTIGVTKNNRQEDGYYVGGYTLPDGTPVKIVAISDGAGGEGRTGFVASSSFLQGVHARIAEAAERGEAVAAGDLFEEGVNALEAQNRFGAMDPEDKARLGIVGDGGAKATASIVVVVGNTATIATFGDANVLHAVQKADGTFRTARYSAADYQEFGIMKNTGLVGSHNYTGAHLYYIDDVPPGSFFMMASDGGHENIHGSSYKLQASDETRALNAKAARVHIPKPTDNTFGPLNQLLTALSGHQDAAVQLHDFAVASMKSARYPTADPIPVGATGFSVTPPVRGLSEHEGKSEPETTNDNVVVAVLQQTTAPAQGLPRPADYENMMEVVAVSQQSIPEVDVRFRVDQKPEHGEHLIIGRMVGTCDGVVPHGTVSSQHANLWFCPRAQGEFEANTWYLRPITDNPTGTKINDELVVKGEWKAVKPGARVWLGGVPLMAFIGGADNSLRFMTDPAALEHQKRQAQKLPSAPTLPAPPTPKAPPAPPSLPSHLQGARIASPVPPPPPSAVQRPAFQLDPSKSGSFLGTAQFRNDPSVAANHVQFLFNPQGGVWAIQDMGSGFPTYDSNGPIKPKTPFRLRTNDWFLIGNFGFSVTVSGDQLLFWPIAADEVQRRLATLRAATTQPSAPALPPPPQAAPPSGRPVMVEKDGVYTVFLQGAQVAHLISSRQKVGTVSDSKPGVYEITIQKVMLLGAQLLTLGRNGGGGMVLQNNSSDISAILATSQDPKDHKPLPSGLRLDVPDGAVLQIDQKQTIVIRSQKP